MVALGIALLALCLGVRAFPEEPLPYRNTIFNDEKLEGQIFEDTSLFSVNTPSSRQESLHRLPTTTKPTHYNIQWLVNITYPTLEFSGTVDIDLQATQPNVDQIVIHCYDLDVDSIKLQLGDTVIDQTHVFDTQYEFLRINLVSGSLNYDATNPTTYRLTIAFNAPLRTDMYGIYRSWYNNNGEVHWMASTQFQATSARMAFPCYDEPSFKATFDITIRRPVAFKSWSCTRQESTGINVADGFADDVYHTTPIMSTYLLALVVSEYKSEAHTELIDGDQQVTYEVIAREQAIDGDQGKYAFEVGQKLLEAMSDHTGIDFYEVHSTIKMTQAAIPDFSAGAMENWGLLTYREAYLLHDENHTNSWYKQVIAYILSHEITHMWFGNLVTCDWWDVLWLNEGFARYYQYYLTDWVEDYMGLGTRFINEQVHSALLADSGNSPPPLSQTGIGSKDDAAGMFNTISYNKGAVIIRMTEHLMGFENHRKGLQKYLDSRKFKTGVPTDLFQSLQEAAEETNAIAAYGSDFNIADYYKSWTEQAGFPVLNIDVNRQTGVVTIHQRRFNINSGYSTANTNWIVPITFATATNPDFNNTKPSHIIREAITIMNMPLDGDEWIIFNKQQTGYYRVNYDDYSWDLIINLLRSDNHELIHEHNRAQIVDDVFNFARAGLMSYDRALNVLSFMKNETAYTPWLAAISGFTWVRNRFLGTPFVSSLNNIFLDWADNVMNELGYEKTDLNEPFMKSFLRYYLAPVMCLLGDETCIASAEDQFEKLFSSGTEVDVDNRGWVYCNALRQGNAEHYEFLWKRFEEHPVETEKMVLLAVLGCTTDEQSLYKYLDKIVEEDNEIRPQDLSTAYNSAVTANEVNIQRVFTYIQNDMDKVRKGLGSLSFPLSYISVRLRTTEEVEQFRDWARQNQLELAGEYQSVYDGAESSVQSMDFAASVLEDFERYVATGDTLVGPTTTTTTTTTTQAPATAAPIEEPTTPGLPDSANTSLLSTLVISLVVAANLILRPF